MLNYHDIGGLFLPIGIAIDVAGNVWIADNLNGSDSRLTQLSPVGVDLSGGGFNDNGLNLPYGVAIAEFNPTGLVLSSGFTGGGLSAPWGIAMDGVGNAWVVNQSPDISTPACVTELSSAGDPLSLPVSLIPVSTTRNTT